MADDKLTVALDEIRQRFSMANYAAAGCATYPYAVAQASAGDVPKLIAVVEAVLALADDLAATTGDAGRGYNATRAAGRRFRAVVSAALLGEGVPDG